MSVSGADGSVVKGVKGVEAQNSKSNSNPVSGDPFSYSQDAGNVIDLNPIDEKGSLSIVKSGFRKPKSGKKAEAGVFKSYNLDAERDILGALLFDNNNMNYVGDFLHSSHFYELVHNKIFNIIMTLIDKGKVAEPQSLEQHFTNDPIYKDIGGAQYLHELYANYAVMSSGLVNIETKGRLVLDLFLKRKLLSIMQDSRNLVVEDRDIMSGEDCIELVEKKLFDLSENLDEFGANGFVSIEKSIDMYLKRVKENKHLDGNNEVIDAGFYDLDRLLSGWHKSDLVIIAARPSMGKTAFAISIALKAAEFLDRQESTGERSASDLRSLSGGSVGVISLEMSAEQLAMRVLSIYSEFSSNQLGSGKFNAEDIPKIIKASEKFAKLPLYIDDTPSATMGHIRKKARRLKRQKNLSILIIDYLQLIRGNSRSENRTQEVSEITRGLKALAKELNIPILALAQLSRGVESRDDKRPMLQDLRESGSIEQDADIVMFIYREAYYLARTMPDHSNAELLGEWNEKYGEKWESLKHRAEIILGKHRNGPIGTVTLRFDQDTTKFDNLSDNS